MRKIAVVNQKGGVGKTTTALNLGASLAEKGKNILLVDVDPQANMTSSLGIEKPDIDIYDILKENLKFSQAILEIDKNYRQENKINTNWGDLHLIASDLDLANAELELASKIGGELLLRKACDISDGDYDYIILDTNPSLGLLTVNALTLADEALIPVEPSSLAHNGMSNLLEIISDIRETFNEKLSITGVLFTRLDGRTNIGEEYFEEFREAYGDVVFELMIHQNVKLTEAQDAGYPINIYAPSARGNKEYQKLAEVIDNE